MAISLNPNYQWAYGNRGEIFNTVGEFDKAILDFEQGHRDPSYILLLIEAERLPTTTKANMIGRLKTIAPPSIAILVTLRHTLTEGTPTI